MTIEAKRIRSLVFAGLLFATAQVVFLVVHDKMRARALDTRVERVRQLLAKSPEYGTLTVRRALLKCVVIDGTLQAESDLHRLEAELAASALPCGINVQVDANKQPNQRLDRSGVPSSAQP